MMRNQDDWFFYFSQNCCILFTKKGEKIVEPFSLQDSSMMANLAKANCLIVREPFDKKRKKGDTVKIIKLDTCF